MYLQSGDKSSCTSKVSIFPIGVGPYCRHHLRNLLTSLMLNKARELSPRFTFLFAYFARVRGYIPGQ